MKTFYTLEKFIQNNLVDSNNISSNSEKLNCLFDENKKNIEIANLLLDDLSTLGYYQKHLKEYPLTKATYSLINLNNTLSKYSTQLVAVESFNTKKITNRDVSVGIESIIDTILEKIKAIFQNIISNMKKIKEIFKSNVEKLKTVLKNVKQRVESLPDQIRESLFEKFTIVDIRMYGQLNKDIQDITSTLVSHEKELVINDVLDSTFKLPLEIIDKRLLQSVGYKQALPRTKVNIYSYSKQELADAQKMLFDTLYYSIDNLARTLDAMAYKNSYATSPVKDYTKSSIGSLSSQLKRILASAEQIEELYKSSYKTYEILSKEFIKVINVRTK